MTEPLRRRLRAQLLGGLSHLGEWMPRRAWTGTLTGAARLFEHGTYARRAHANLRIAYGDELSSDDAQRIVRGTLRHGARLFAEWLRLARVTPAQGTAIDGSHWIEQAVALDPTYEILRHQHARRRGVIVVTPHLGNWELLAARLRRAGHDGAVIGRKRARDSSSDWMVRMRQAYGVTTIPQDTSPRTLLETLKAGGVLGVLPDLEVRRLAGEFLPFFGVPALTMTAPAALARAHRLPLVPARCVLSPGAGPSDRYTLSFAEPLELNPALPRREATLDLTRRLNDLFETWIRETPEQWAWHQHRWRTRPGEIEPVPLAERRRRKGAAREGPPTVGD